MFVVKRRPDRRAAAGHRRAARRAKTSVVRQRPAAGPDRRHRRPAAARGRHHRRRPAEAGRAAPAAASGRGQNHESRIAESRVRATSMNVSEDFHQAADRHQPADGGDRAVRPRRLSLAAGQRPAERRLPDAARHGAAARRRARRRWASSVATPLENQFSMIAGLESMTSVNSLGSTQITLRVRPEPQPRRRGGRRAGGDHAGGAPAAAGHADAADLHEGEPGGPADPLSGHHVDDAAAVDARRVRRNAHRASASRWSAASRRCRCSAARSSPSTCSSIPHALARAPDRHQRGRGGAAATGTSTLPTGTIIGPHKTYTLQATGQLMNADAVQGR